jgi:hypothetical protein
VRTRHFILLLVPLALAILAGVIVIGIRWRDAQSAELIVPTGFRGYIHVVPSLSAPAGDGTFVVPAGGVLKVAEFDRFRKLKWLSARFSDGAPLPNAMAVGSAPDTIQIYLHHACYSPDGGEVWLWVGKLEDFLRILESAADSSAYRPTPGSVVPSTTAPSPDSSP